MRPKVLAAPAGCARGICSPQVCVWYEQTCTRMRGKAGSLLHQSSQEQMEKAVAPQREAPLQGCPGLYQGINSSLRTVLEILARQATGRQWSQHGAGLWAAGCCGMHRETTWQEWVRSHCWWFCHGSVDAAKKWFAIALFNLAHCNLGVTSWLFKVSFYPTSSDLSWMLNCLQKLLLVCYNYINFLIIVIGRICPPHQAFARMLWSPPFPGLRYYILIMTKQEQASDADVLLYISRTASCTCHSK